MEHCPECKGEMGQRDVVCPHCGYDFQRELDAAHRRPGWAYSVWADTALMVGAVVATFACIASACYSLAMVLQCQFFQGLVQGPVGFLLCLAMLVVFVRIQDV